MIKLIASDLDGTLLQNGAQALPWGCTELIRQLYETYGILFVAASGRQYPNLKRLFEPVSDCMGFICENGALVYYRDELIYEKPMERAVAIAITKDIINRKGCEAQISGRDAVHLLPKDKDFADYLRNVVKNNVCILSSLESYTEPFYKVSVYKKDGIAGEACDYFTSRWEHAAKCTVSGRCWLDFVHPEVNKGAALLALLKRLNIQPESAIAFGDNYNDLEMLSLVSRGYVMENAAEDIKKRYPLRAKDVCLTIREEVLAR